MIDIIFLETIFTILTGEELQSLILKLLLAIPIGLILDVLLNSLKNKKIKTTLKILTEVVLTLIFCIYYIYYKTFGSVISVYSLIHGTGVLKFETSVINTLKNNLSALAFFIPLFFHIIIVILFRKKECKAIKNRTRIITIIVSIIIYVIAIIVINLDNEENIYSKKNLYYNVNNPSKNISQFGVITTLRLDIQRTIINFKEKDLYKVQYNGEEKIINKDEYNVQNIDFDALIKSEENEEIKSIHQYLSEQTPTNKNKYTGMFKDKNLIVIVAESFSSLAIREDVTPTLYKMANQGVFKFNNFYTPLFPISTADGEYLTDTSLIPAEGTWSMTQVANNYMPYSYANELKKQGYKTFAYHNYDYDYYNRDKYLNAMGYEKYLANGNGLEERMDFSKNPSSDLEMIEASIYDYINEEKFLAYYMTMSGHMNYDKKNSMVEKNWDKVKDLPYSDKVKGYLATQIELDKALEKIIDTLKENNKLEDTVIILTGDHYSYGLTEDEIKEISPHDMGDYYFEKFHMPFIVYNGENSKTVEINKYASSLDVLPTVLNLFGIEFDSRLLMGRDIMSNADPLIIMSDRSFIIKEGKYNSLIEQFRPFEDKKITDDEIKQIKEKIYHKYRYSRLMLKNNYYEKIKEYLQ